MLTDSHAHLDGEEFSGELKPIIDRAHSENVSKFITVGTDEKSSHNALVLAQQYECIYSAIGYHPHHASKMEERELRGLAELAGDPRIVGWGEIGLDFFRCYCPAEEQTKAFIRQLKMADDLGLPVIVHDRQAHESVLQILKKRGKGLDRGVIHCFSGDFDLAMEFIRLGYYISISGIITYRNASKLREVVSRIPMEGLMVETDSPYLSPVPKKGERNEPSNIRFTVHEIARLRKTDFMEVALQTTNNACRLFGIH